MINSTEMTDLLHLQKILNKGKCTEFIKAIVTSKEIAEKKTWKCKHLSYLVVKSELPGSGIAATLSCDLSNISWKNLFAKSDLDCLTLQAILSLGGSITMQDIEEYLSVENENNELSILNLAIDKCTPSLSVTNLNELCHLALKSKKVSIVDMMITSQEVALDPSIVLKTFDYYYQDLSTCVKILKLATEKCSPPLTCDNLSFLCKNAVKHNNFKLVSELISLGAKLDAAVVVKECRINAMANDPIILELLFEKCIPPLKNEELNKLCEKAVKSKKINLVEKLLSHGAILDATTLIKEYSVYEMSNNLDILKVAMEKCTPSLNEESLNELCKNAAHERKIILVEELISFGATLDGDNLMKNFSIDELSHSNYSKILDLATGKCSPPLDKENLYKLCEDPKCRKLGLVEELISHGVNLDATIMISKFNIHEISCNFNIVNVAMEKCIPALSKDDLNKLCETAADSKELNLAIKLISCGATLDAAIIVKKFNAYEISHNLKILDVVTESCIPPLSDSDLNKLCEEAAQCKLIPMVTELLSRGAILDANILVKAFDIHEISGYPDFFDLAMKKCIPPLSSYNLNKICEEAANHKKITLVMKLITLGAKLDASVIMKTFDIHEFNTDILKVATEECVPPLSSSDLNKLCDEALKCKNYDTVRELLACGATLDCTVVAGKLTKGDIISKKNVVLILESTPEGCVQLFLKAFEYFQFAMAHYFLHKGSKKVNTATINLSVLIPKRLLKIEWKDCISNLSKLLDYGINPDGIAGDKKECPLDVVLKLTKDQQTEKIELLTLLLKHDAAIENCTYPRVEGTTFLHIVTKLALESGIS